MLPQVSQLENPIFVFAECLNPSGRCYKHAEDGNMELNWYQIGVVKAIDNGIGMDYVYIGDTNIWPGNQI